MTKLKACPRCKGELEWKDKRGVRANVANNVLTLRAWARCQSCERTFAGIRKIPVTGAGQSYTAEIDTAAIAVRV